MAQYVNTFYISSGPFMSEAAEFVEKFARDKVLAGSYVARLNISYLAVINTTAQLVLDEIPGSRVTIHSIGDDTLIRASLDNDDLALIELSRRYSHEAGLTKVVSSEHTFKIHGEPNFVIKMEEKLATELPAMNKPKLTWTFMCENKRQEHPFVLDECDPAHDEHYPFIEGGLNKFYDDYLASTAAVLILMGDPGTGKSTFLRNFIAKKNIHTMFTYDQELLTSDEMFVNFMLSPTNNLLVMEDADIMMGKREAHGNDMMSKLLNVSDGLMKIKSKKMVFTTNITDRSKFDEALTRPGRCFAVLNFRALSYEEACRAADVSGMPIPLERRSYTLTEIFRQSSDIQQSPVRRMGFGR